jgi:threonine dehydratase
MLTYTRGWTVVRLQAGEPVDVEMFATLADGLAVPKVGARAFEVARAVTDRTVLVSEKEIALAILRCIEAEKLMVEGAGAAGLAAILPGGRCWPFVPLPTSLPRFTRCTVP